MRVEPSIFKAYDIRGLYPTQIDATVAYALGRAYATFISRELPQGKKPRVAVGSDARTSSPELKAALMRGLTESGVDVDDIGLVSTPSFYFAVGHVGADGGIQVSASHNPKEWNGFKITRAKGVPVSFESGISDMKRMIEEESYVPLVEASARGSVRAAGSITDPEITEQCPTLNPSAIKSFRVAIDTANGMGALDMEALFARLSCEVVWMNKELDGTFPNHPADPLRPENTADLRAKIPEAKCDLGIASDGDGDRYFFFDEKGDAVPQEVLRGLVAQILLAQTPGAPIVYDIRPGRITKEMIDEASGVGIVAPVGHSLIKEKMLETGAIFGGESSGHFFFKLPCGTFEAPLVLVSTLLSYISAQGKPLSAIVAPYKRYHNSGEINTKLPTRDAGLQKIEAIKKQYADGTQNLLDGVFVEYPEWSFLVRLSNTEPLIRLIVEATSEAVMKQKSDELVSFIKS